VLNCLNIKR